jgi:hypothetical protein
MIELAYAVMPRAGSTNGKQRQDWPAALPFRCQKSFDDGCGKTPMRAEP